MTQYFIDNVLGDAANDGLDNVGFGLSDASYGGDVGGFYQITKLNAFTDYDWAFGDVIYVSASGGNLAVGLYEIASKANDSGIRLNPSPTLPGCLVPSNDTDTGVASSDGPMDDVTIVNATSGTMLVAGDTVWIRKTGTPYTTMMEPATNAAAGARIKIIGYDAYPDDNCLVPFSSIERLVKASGVSNYFVANLACVSPTSHGLSAYSGDRWLLWNIKLTASGSAYSGVSVDIYDIIMVGVEVSGFAVGISISTEGTLDACDAHDCGIGIALARGHISNTRAYANTTAQIKMSSTAGASSIDHCVIDGRSAAVGILQDLTPDTAIQPMLISDSVIMRCTTGLDPDSAGHALDNVVLWGNTTDYAAGEVDVLNAGPSGDPMFVDADNGDYTLQAGSPLIGAGSAGGNIGWDQSQPAGMSRAINLGMQV